MQSNNKESRDASTLSEHTYPQHAFVLQPRFYLFTGVHVVHYTHLDSRIQPAARRVKPFFFLRGGAEVSPGKNPNLEIYCSVLFTNY